MTRQRLLRPQPDHVADQRVTAHSLRNLAEIGNQPVDGTRRDPRLSLGGRGRGPRGTVPGGLNPHSEVGSGGAWMPRRSRATARAASLARRAGAPARRLRGVKAALRGQGRFSIFE